MTVIHLVFLVEEPSMEAFLNGLLPRVLAPECTFEVHSFQCKADLLTNLPVRLKAYAKWLPENWRIVVVVDRDQDDCHELKKRLEAIAACAGLNTRTCSANKTWQLVNRIVIEELEAWYFGCWQAVCAAYPRVSSMLIKQKRYRHSDEIQGGTWEAFERVMKRYGYFQGGLNKIEAARSINLHVDPLYVTSPSFRLFCDTLGEICRSRS